MGAGVVICAVIGHKWHTVESDVEVEPVLECSRCGRQQLAPNATGIGVRTKVRGDAYGSFLKK
jgi:hypothetical protein